MSGYPKVSKPAITPSLMGKFVRYGTAYYEGGGWVYTPFGAVRGTCSRKTGGGKGTTQKGDL